ncbi:MAG: hypothetical protein ABI947_01250 [Chloroflexota bacterium]
MNDANNLQSTSESGSESELYAHIKQSIEETHTAVDEALGFIERQEDGPFTMTAALKDIDSQVDAIATEVSCLMGSVEVLHAAAVKLHVQRDEAIRQRNLLVALYHSKKRR